MAVLGAETINSPDRPSRHLSGSPRPAARGDKGWLANSIGKIRYFLPGNQGFRGYDFLVRRITKAQQAGAWWEGEKAYQEGYHGNTDFWGGDPVGRILGNIVYFPVEYGPKG